MLERSIESYPRTVRSAAVLVVDDDAPIRRMLERTLGAEGYAVTSAHGGGEALVEVERAVPDLLVLDVAMPGLDGLEVCRRMRAKGLAVPILLLTGDKSRMRHATMFAAMRQCKSIAAPVVISNAGHAAHRDNPAAFNAAVLAFLEAN